MAILYKLIQTFEIRTNIGKPRHTLVYRGLKCL
nr:MAG TPA: hypothetical protein [Caudoviricetes sp.]